MDQDINFTLNFIDNITASVNRIEGNIDGLNRKMDALDASTTRQNVKFTTQMVAVRSLDIGMRGLSNVTGEIIGQNNIVTRSLRGMSTAVHGVASAYQVLKGGRQVLMMLRSAEVSLASVESFRAALKGKMGLVFLGLAGAAGTAGYFAGQASVDNSTSVNQTVVFGGSAHVSDNRAMSRELLSIMGGYG